MSTNRFPSGSPPSGLRVKRASRRSSFKQATGPLRLQAADAVSFAYVEAKPCGFGFDDEEGNVPSLVKVLGQVGQQRLEHGDVDKTLSNISHGLPK